VTYAITANNWTLAQQQVSLLTQTINAASSNLQGSTSKDLKPTVIGLSFAFAFVTLVLILATIRIIGNRRPSERINQGTAHYHTMLDQRDGRQPEAL